MPYYSQPDSYAAARDAAAPFEDRDDGPDFTDEDFYPKDSPVCRQCRRGDHADCAIITWQFGTCQCGSCGLVSKEEKQA